MQKSLLILTGCVAAVLLGLVTFRPQALFAAVACSGGVIPFSTSGGNVAFFDQSSGKIYFYDNNVQKCLYIAQLQGLGNSIKYLDVKASESRTTETEAPETKKIKSPNADFEYRDPKPDMNYHTQPQP